MPEELERQFVGSLAWCSREAGLIDLGEKFKVLCTENGMSGNFQLAPDEAADEAMKAFEAHLQIDEFRDTPLTLASAIFSEITKNTNIGFVEEDLNMFVEFVELCRAEYNGVDIERNGVDLEIRAQPFDDQRNTF